LSLLDGVFKSIYALQITPDPGLGPGGNYVLNGIKGVGKTTILHVAGAIAACSTKNVVPVY
jgi:ABC-type lipoprotein export system ATPase subunit